MSDPTYAPFPFAQQPQSVATQGLLAPAPAPPATNGRRKKAAAKKAAKAPKKKAAAKKAAPKKAGKKRGPRRTAVATPAAVAVPAVPTPAMVKQATKPARKARTKAAQSPKIDLATAAAILSGMKPPDIAVLTQVMTLLQGAPKKSRARVLQAVGKLVG